MFRDSAARLAMGLISFAGYVKCAFFFLNKDNFRVRHNFNNINNSVLL